MLLRLAGLLALGSESPEQYEDESRQTERDRYNPEQSVETPEGWRQEDRGPVSGAHQFKYLFVRTALLDRIC